MIGRSFLKGMRSMNVAPNKLVNSQIVRNLSDYGSQDMAFTKDRIMKKEGEDNQRDFTYFFLGGGRFIYASAARLALIKVSIYFYFISVLQLLLFYFIFFVYSFFNFIIMLFYNIN